MASRKFGIVKSIQKKRLKRQLTLTKKQGDRPLAERPFDSTRVLVDSGGVEKMSEVLDRFVEPYMKLATTDVGVRRIYSYGTAAWNASFFSVDKQNETIDRILTSAHIPDEGQIVVRSLLLDMIERKKAYFATDHRVILDYRLTDTGDGFHLTVIALLP